MIRRAGEREREREPEPEPEPECWVDQTIGRPPRQTARRCGGLCQADRFVCSCRRRSSNQRRAKDRMSPSAGGGPWATREHAQRPRESTTADLTTGQQGNERRQGVQAGKCTFPRSTVLSILSLVFFFISFFLCFFFTFFFFARLPRLHRPAWVASIDSSTPATCQTLVLLCPFSVSVEHARHPDRPSLATPGCISPADAVVSSWRALLCSCSVPLLCVSWVSPVPLSTVSALSNLHALLALTPSRPHAALHGPGTGAVFACPQEP